MEPDVVPPPVAGFDWSLVFSAPGAVIFGCITLLVIFFGFVAFRERLGALRVSLPGGGAIESVHQESAITKINSSSGQNKGSDPADAPPTLTATASSPVENDPLHTILISDDSEEIKKAFLSLRQNGRTELFGMPIEYAELRALIRINDKSTVDTLKDYERERRNDFYPSEFLSTHFIWLNDYATATSHVGVLKRRNYARGVLVESRLIRHRDGVPQAIRYLLEHLKDAEINDRKQILTELAELYENTSEDRKRMLAIERAISCDPADLNLRFQAAYLSTELGFKHRALRHYEYIVNINERYPNALNNLGNTYDSLDMPIAAIERLTRASKFDHPYPLGNLAIRLAEKGFVDEARARLAEIPEYYRNRSRAVEAANFIHQRESAEEKALQKNRHYADALDVAYRETYSPTFDIDEIDTASVVGDWRDDDKQERLSIELKGDMFEFTLWKNGSKARSGTSKILPTGHEIEFVEVGSSSSSYSLLGLSREKRAVFVGDGIIVTVEGTATGGLLRRFRKQLPVASNGL